MSATRLLRPAVILLLGMAASSCEMTQSVMRSFPADPAVKSAAATLQTDVIGFYDALRAQTAPACDFASHSADYARFKSEAGTLTERARATPSDSALIRAATKIEAAIADAERSHQLASARTDDANGACMAAGAITLNKDAIGRAVDGVIALQNVRGGA